MKQFTNNLLQERLIINTQQVMINSIIDEIREFTFNDVFTTFNEEIKPDIKMWIESLGMDFVEGADPTCGYASFRDED